MSKSYESLDDFFGITLGIVQAKILTAPTQPSDIYKSHCSCISFYKHHKCKHILGISSRITLPNKKSPFAFRQDCKNVAIGTNRKRGKPGHAVKALFRQDQLQTKRYS